MRQTYSAGGVVIGPTGKVLVVNQNGDSWSLPKGHIDPGESEEEAARREIKEESGIKRLNYCKVLGNYTRYLLGRDGKDDQSELKHITVLLYTTQETKLQPEDPRNPEARWVKPELVANMLTHPKDKKFFQSILPQLKEYVA